MLLSEVKPLPARAQDALSDHLSVCPWQVFGTLTYRSDVKSHEKVERDFRKWLQNITLKHIGVNPKNKQAQKRFRAQEGPALKWVRCIEPHRKGDLHVHFVLGPPPKTLTNKDTWLRTQLAETWSDPWIRSAGFSKIEGVQSKRLSTDYLVKASRYCTKSGNASSLDWNGIDAWDDLSKMSNRAG